jgi:membrane-associated phospholipid phosphatase
MTLKIELFYKLPRNVIAIFTGRNLLWHALAIVLTIMSVMSGFDWFYYRSTRVEALLQLARPAIMFGAMLPALVTLVILIVGEVRKNRRIITTAWALGQTAILSYIISCCYKAFTGRTGPPFRGFRISDNTSLIDTSHGFQFGFIKGGVFWGWPSSHTTVTFAMTACLITLYPKNKPLVFLALLYAVYIGLGVSVTIHWFSDFVAGAIIGSMIGTVVGRSFRIKLT